MPGGETQGFRTCSDLIHGNIVADYLVNFPDAFPLQEFFLLRGGGQEEQIVGGITDQSRALNSRTTILAKGGKGRREKRCAAGVSAFRPLIKSPWPPLASRRVAATFCEMDDFECPALPRISYRPFLFLRFQYIKKKFFNLKNLFIFN